MQSLGMWLPGLLFFYCGLVQAIPPNNKCIVNETHIIKHSGSQYDKNDFSNISLTTPESGSLEYVGQNYCGFVIKGMNAQFCPNDLEISFSSFNVREWGEFSKGYCLIYYTYAECVCPFYGCNSISGILYESLLETYKHEVDDKFKDSNGNSLQKADEREKFIEVCTLRLIEEAYNITPSFYAPPSNRVKDGHPSVLKHRTENPGLYPNATAVQELKNTDLSLTPTTNPPPPAPGSPGAPGSSGGLGAAGGANGSMVSGGGNGTSNNSSSGSGSKGSDSVVFIAIGVCGGILLLAALGIAGVFFYRKRSKSRMDAKLEHDVQLWLEELTKENNFLKTVVEPKYLRIREEFNANPIKSHEYSKDTHRYHDILCIEETRIKTDDPNFFYHANDIFLADGKRVIAAQGPKEKTIADFWKMIVFTGSDLILMLCNFIEEGKEKCAPYFGLNEGNVVKFGDYEIETEMVSEMEMAAYTARTLNIKHPGGKHSVIHMQFYEWNDHSRPNDLKLLALIQHVRDKEKNYKLLTVHCSAGVGRTGTFIGVMEAEAMLKHERRVDLYEVLTRLRHRRQTMIQNEEQFAAVHMVLIDRLANMQLISRDSLNYKKFATENVRYAEYLKKKAEERKKAAEKKKENNGNIVVEAQAQ